MELRVSPLRLTKRYPLTISRGTAAGSDNLLLEVLHDGITGIGEVAPVNIGHGDETAESMAEVIYGWRHGLTDAEPWQMQRIESILGPIEGAGSARAALDMACFDWLGKRAGLPVYSLLGGDLSRIATTSITIGINPPDVVRGRVKDIINRLRPGALKIKLGSPDGIEVDREMFRAVQESAPSSMAIRVDANGGWSLADAQLMVTWLADRGVEYVEQPLALGRESELPELCASSPVPIFADESCRFASDIPRLSGIVHGVNLKLMKCGGIREALRLIHTARAHGLAVMIGCMSESSLAISAGAHLSPLADHLDLDSHLNLLPDPFSGLGWEDGRVLPSAAPGLGVRLTD